MAVKPATTLWQANTANGASAEFQHNGGPQGIYVMGVLGGGDILLESKLPTTDIDTWVPVQNGSFNIEDMCPTEYTVSGTTAYGILKIMTSTPGTYRLRLIGAVSPTVWAYMIGS